MVTAVVTLQLADSSTLETATAAFEATAPHYLAADGLVRKYYLFDPDSHVGGGCYLMSDRATAERFFDDTWRAQVESQYGGPPTVAIYDTPVIVDNVVGRIELGVTA